MRYSLARGGEPQLAFDGTQLARVSSVAPGKQRWTELTLYETNAGSYVVQTVARSTHGNEVDWFSARVYDTIEAAIDGLRDKKRRTLSKLALELIEVAAEDSHLVLDALEKIEGTEEVIS